MKYWVVIPQSGDWDNFYFTRFKLYEVVNDNQIVANTGDVVDIYDGLGCDDELVIDL